MTFLISKKSNMKNLTETKEAIELKNVRNSIKELKERLCKDSGKQKSDPSATNEVVVSKQKAEC